MGQCYASSSMLFSVPLVKCSAESGSLQASRAPFQSVPANSRAGLGNPVLDVRSQPLKKIFLDLLILFYI